MPKRRTRRPARSVPASRGQTRSAQRPPAPAPSPAPLPSLQQVARPAAVDLPDPQWEYCTPLAAVVHDVALREWLDESVLVHTVDGLLAWVGEGRALEDGALSEDAYDDALRAVGVHSRASALQQDRAGLLIKTCVACSVLAVDGEVLRRGPTAEVWTSTDAVARAWMRGLVSFGVLEAAVRVLPGRSYHGEQVTVALSAAVAAAVSPDPWSIDGVSRRVPGLLSSWVAGDVRDRLAELQVLGVFAAGPLLVPPSAASAVVEAVARALAATPVPVPRHPDARVKGPTFEIEAVADVGGEPRSRRVLIGGGSAVALLTDLLMTVFGLREEGRLSQLTGLALPALLAEPGLLTRTGADRHDRWTLSVGGTDRDDAGSARAPAVVDHSVSVESLVEHLGQEWELPVTVWGADTEDDDVLLHLRVLRTIPAQASRDLVFPACTAGEGQHLVTTAMTGSEVDLAALDVVVARVHRGS